MNATTQKPANTLFTSHKTLKKEFDMRRKISLAFLATVWTFVLTDWVAADSVQIIVEDVKSAEGKLMLQVLAGEAEFKGEAVSIASILRRAQTGTMAFTLTGLPAGEYAIRIMHDENNNDELDANFVGMPTEPYAFSNNAKGNFGPPTWDDVKFDLTGDVVQTIKLGK